MKKIYLLRGLDCPNCAAKIEREALNISGVCKSSINLMKQTLTLELDGDCSEVDNRLSEIVRSHEPHVTVTEFGSGVHTVESNHAGDTVHSHEGAHSHDGGNASLMIIRLAVAAVLFAAGIALPSLTEVSDAVGLALLAVSYAISAYDVLWRALRGIFRGHVLDESFLMSIASIGAFLIGEAHEAVGVMLFYQVGEFFQHLAVERSRRSISALLDIRPDTARVIRNGEVLSVHPDSVDVGEVILVRPGERLPLDGKVVEGESTLDRSALTGESIPCRVREGDEVLSGSVNGGGMLRVRVTKVFGESSASRIIELVEHAQSRKAPTENFITRFAQVYTPVVVAAALLIALVPPLIAGGWAEWLRRALILLVISCPCALVISIPLSFFGGIGAASARGVLVKGGNYLEALASVDTVVLDKTGTLTRGAFTVTSVTGSEGFTPDEVLRYAAAAEIGSSHPIARSVVAAYGEVDMHRVSGYVEIPGRGVTAECFGRRVIAGSRALLEENGIRVPSVNQAGSVVTVAVNGEYAGHIVIRDEIKDGCAAALSRLRKLGVRRIVMLTGDSKEVAAEVAKELCLDGYRANLLPADKTFHLEEIMHHSGKTAFVGDGINDAPVLARADVGVAMGALGSDAAIEASDVVLTGDSFDSLCDAIEISRRTKRIVRQNIVLALGVKASLLLLGALGVAGMWAAVFADVGVALLAVLNALRILKN